MVNPRFPRKCKAARPPSPRSDIGAPPSKKQRKEAAKKPKEKKEPAEKKKELAKGSSASAAAAVQSPRAAAPNDADDAGQDDNKVPDKGPGKMTHKSPIEDPYRGFDGIRCWDDLWYLVHSFVQQQVVDKVQWATLDAGTKERLTSWAPKAEEYLSYPSDSPSTQAPPPGLC
jgi:hypothetical protein